MMSELFSTSKPDNSPDIKAMGEKPHWTANPWLLYAILIPLSLSFLLSPLLAVGLFVFTFLFIQSKRKKQGLETLGTWKPGVSTLIALLLSLTAILILPLYGIVSAFFSFQSFDVSSGMSQFGNPWPWWASLHYLFSDPNFQHVLCNTIEGSALQLPIKVMLVLPFVLSISLLYPALRLRHSMMRSALLLCAAFVLPVLLIGSLLASVVLPGGKAALSWVAVPAMAVSAALLVLAAVWVLTGTRHRIIDAVLLLLPFFTVARMETTFLSDWSHMFVDDKTGMFIWLPLAYAAVYLFVLRLIFLFRSKRTQARGTETDHSTMPTE